MSRFFFITSYDSISSAIIANLLNAHPDIDCKASNSDYFLLQDAAWLSNNSYFNHLQTIETEDLVSVDNFIHTHNTCETTFNGNVQQFTAYQLQHKTLMEKTVAPHRKANLILAPTLRVSYLLQSWEKAADSPQEVLKLIESNLVFLQSCGHILFQHYNFPYYYEIIKSTVIAKNYCNLANPQDQLFILALAKVLALDSADLPTPIKSFSYEKLLHSEEELVGFVRYLTNDVVNAESACHAELRKALTATQIILQDFPERQWKNWQLALIDLFIHKRLYTPFYPHVNKPASAFYAELGYQKFAENESVHYSKLVSIQLNSNRPAQLSAYFDNIEETADNPGDIEILVNIDTDSAPMKSLLDAEIPKRKFTLKYIETPRPASFCDLWRPINELLKITDPDAYFLLNISDEMFFATHGWDTLLKKYVGFFPDNIFRLRASRNKFRNYYDRWECSFAQDAIPITTKRWVDIGGDWNPCFGPDSFQQLISFYLTQYGKFTNENLLREIPIVDIKLAGDIPALGIDAEKSWRHNRDHIKAMQICQSYPMQLEAKRRAALIRAHILCHEQQLINFNIINNTAKKQIHLINNDNAMVVEKISYHLNWWKINFINQYRKLYFFCYFGGGLHQKVKIIKTFAAYLRSSSPFWRKQLGILSKIKNNRHRGRIKRAVQKIKVKFNASSFVDLQRRNSYLNHQCEELRVQNKQLKQEIQFLRHQTENA